MRKYLFVLLLLSFCTISQAQQHKLGLVGTYGISEPFESGTGSAYYDLGAYYNLGLLYEKKINKRWKVETGVVWAKYHTGKSYLDYFSPDLSKKQYAFTFQSLQIPVNFKFNFLKYLFINAGIVANLQLDQIDKIKTSGIGANIGIGGKYDFKNGHTLFINPYLATQNISSIKKNAGIIEMGIRVGFLFAL